MSEIFAFQGALGSYSHQACLEIRPDVAVLPCRTFEAAVDAVREGRATHGVLPIENSTHGRVADMHHLLPESGLYIVGEHFVRVHIDVLGLPSASIGKVKRAISHPVLFEQTRKYLKDNSIDWESWSDNGEAARHVSEAGDPELVALASPLAGKLYGLTSLAQAIETQKSNRTRFLILSRENAVPAQSDHIVTTFIFQVRSIPAALYKALGGFATNGVNMTKLESYLKGGRFEAAEFYADIEGHPDDPAVQRAMEDVDYFTERLDILGVYPRSPARDIIAAE